jgi:integrase
MAKMKKPVITKYAGGQYRPAPNGNGFDCSITVHGQRYKSRQPDELKARDWMDERLAKRYPPLTREQIEDAQKACAILPKGYTLFSITSELVNRKNHLSVFTKDAIAQFLENQKAHIKPVSLAKYTHHLTRLSVFNDKKLEEVTAADLENILTIRNPTTRNGAIIHWQAFFTWCLKQGWLPNNQALALRKSRPSEPPKGILTLAQAEKLLRVAEELDSQFIPYLAIGLFAGVRPAELCRMTDASIVGEYIRLTGKETKTADARTIPIRNNLAQWLEKYPPKGNIAPLSHHWMSIHLGKLKEKAEILDWPSDCMRHSFATYAYELEKDASKISSEMGHHGTEIFFRHYRAMAHPGEGKKFFEICPKKDEKRDQIGNDLETVARKSLKINKV